MMDIDIVISCEDIKEDRIRDKVVVVVDMLRATTVIITALKNGCSEVIPVLDVDDAMELSVKDRDKYILGGERRALKIAGFDCSNSPLEYTKEAVEGKSLIITTTNGTRAIEGSKAAEEILLGALINAKSVAYKLAALNKGVVIVNAGTYGQFSMDDFICSGYIIDCLSKMTELQMSDIAFTSHYIFKNNEDIISYIKNARHFNVLKELGLEKDLEYCCCKDITDAVPVYRDGAITIL